MCWLSLNTVKKQEMISASAIVRKERSHCYNRKTTIRVMTITLGAHFHCYRSCYRMHISNCIPFSEKIAVAIEHGAGNAHFIDYSSVAYWYQKAKPWINSGGFKI